MKWTKNKIFKLNSPFFVITSIIACIFLILFGFWIGGKCTVNSHAPYDNATHVRTTSKGYVKYSEDGNDISVWKEDSNGNKLNDFNLLTIGDIHLANQMGDLELKIIQNYIDLQHPDLVVLMGDNVSNVTDYVWQQKIVKMFEDKQQYWTFVLGNHDFAGLNDKYGDYEAEKLAFTSTTGEMFNQNKKPSKYCLARSKGDTTKLGFGTNKISIVGKDNKILKNLFFFDCNWVGGKTDQYIVDWYKSEIDSSIKSIAFSHIPLPEMKYAVEHKNEAVVHWGITGEEVGIKGNSKLFSAFKENGTNTVIFAHDHYNNICLTYDGVTMAYTLGQQYNMYCSRMPRFAKKPLITRPFNGLYYMLDYNLCDFIEGATKIYIEDNSIEHPYQTISDSFSQFDGSYKGLETYIWVRCMGLITYNGKWLTICNRIFYPILSAGILVYYGLLIYVKVKDDKHEKVRK